MCTACHPIDTTQIDAFGARLLDVFNHGALALMLSLGHRTGLFDTMAGLEPATSEGIARAAGLNERYVREWLGAMLLADVVRHDAASGTWHLPPERAACLTRASAPNNLAGIMQYVGLLGSAEDRILECFRNGGGVPYSEFRRFHEVMAEDSGQTVLPALFDRILPLDPEIVAKLETGADVLDLGCGRGIALRLMAARFPRSRFVGIDLSDEAIAWARAEADRHGLANLRYESADATRLDLENAFDLVFTFDAIHDQARPDLVLRNIARALRPDGIYLMQDIHASSRPHENIGHPAGIFLYTVSTMHCMTVSLAAGGLGLGTMWGRQLAERMLSEAGFAPPRVERLAHDFQNDYYIVRRAA